MLQAPNVSVLPVGKPLRIARQACAKDRATDAPDEGIQPGWTILVVDDDREVHEATAFSLHGMTLQGRKLNFETAYSAQQAFELLRDGLRPAVILLDVVMEKPGAGLDLVRRIRDELDLSAPRIILRTGQPGYAPEAEIVVRYDIDDYLTKANLTQVSLLTSIMGALRAFQAIRSLEVAAFTDGLTGLANRQGLIRHLDSRSAKTSVGRRLALVDLRHFIDIDGPLGHDIGDRVLTAVAARLGRIDDVELVARLHGDVFGLVGGEAVSVQAIQSALARPITIDDNLFLLEARIGFAALRHDAGSGTRAVRDASVALNRAKKSRGSVSAVYDDAMESELSWRLRTIHDLRRAFEAKTLEVWYQPQIDLASGRVIGVEALARWPDGPGPDVFVPLAEYSGLIVPMGRWVFETAIADMHRLDIELCACTDRESALSGAPGAGLLRLSVNVSVEQLRTATFTRHVADLVRNTSFASDRLVLEVTESVLVDEPEHVTAELSALRSLGITVALDDFGTGHASISSLRHLPIDRIKIDRSFVGDIGSPRGGAFARLIVELAQDLGLSVVAEGVETEEQAAFLCSSGCQTAQGYLYARPMPFDALSSWLAARRRSNAPKSNRSAPGGPAH